MRNTTTVVVVVAAVAILMSGYALATIFTGTTPEAQGFNGFLLDPPQRAPDFTLVDHLGNPINLRDFRGKTVVLTFVYTHCTTFCPLVTMKFVGIEKAHRESLGEDVVFIAITTDPERDTLERIREYRQAYGYDGYLLTGSFEELEIVWEEYGVYVEYVPLEGNETLTTNLLGGEGEYGVNHTAEILLIDKQGMVRVVHLGYEWENEDLVSDIIILRDD